jgi:predicted dehydrogenase
MTRGDLALNDERLGIGVVGAGMFGKLHVKFLRENPRARLTWVCDTDRNAAKEAAECSAACFTDDVRELLRDGATCAVVIATPPWLHHEMTVAALNAGKHVLCEKPLGINPLEADEAVSLARSKGLTLADCSARHARFNPKYRFIKEMIREKKLGDVYFIKYTYRERRDRFGIEYNPNAKWALDKAKAGGGPAHDWGVYDLSFIFGLFDDQLVLKDTSAFAFHGVDAIDPGTPVFDTEEHLAAMLRFEGGLSVSWEVGTACHGQPKRQIEIFGSRGGINCSPLTWDVEPIVFYDDGPDGPRLASLEVPGLKEHADDLPFIDDDFVEAVLSGREPEMPGWKAARILTVIDAVYRSAGIR